MFKQGYAIEITSWENDGDCYNTKRIDGLSLQKVTAIAKFCDYYAEDVRSQEIPTDQQVLDLFAIMPEEIEDPDDVDHKRDVVHDKIYEFFGFSDWGTPRVCESYQVYYFPTEIQPITLKC